MINGFMQRTKAQQNVMSAARSYIRTGHLHITGVTDNTQVTLELNSDYEGEALASETVDTDTPTGGTRFDISADGYTLTIHTTKTVVAIVSDHIHSNDVGTDYSIHSDALGGDITVQMNNSSTGAQIDFSNIANGKLLEVGLCYLTSD